MNLRKRMVLEVEYDCPECDYSSRGRSSVDLHRRAEHSNIADPDYEILTCPECSGEYYASASIADDRKFCSKACGAAARNERRGNPPGRDYGYNWEEMSDAARQRDGNECVDCGSTIEQNQKMEVHHIVECGFFEDDEKRNDLRNLVTLCFSCHKLWENATDEEQLENLRRVMEDADRDDEEIENRLGWIRSQQERLKS